MSDQLPDPDENPWVYFEPTHHDFDRKRGLNITPVAAAALLVVVLAALLILLTWAVW